MKEIPMGNGLLALVDDEDWDRVKMHRWFLYKGRRTYYAGTKIAGHNTYLHRFILHLGVDTLLDHKDGNGLNCCRLNMRECTPSQNAANGVGRKGKKYRGVGVDKRRGSFYAQVTKNYKNYYLGSFLTEEDAARAYDQSARAFHGEFARLNFPNEEWSTT